MSIGGVEGGGGKRENNSVAGSYYFTELNICLSSYLTLFKSLRFQEPFSQHHISFRSKLICIVHSFFPNRLNSFLI